MEFYGVKDISVYGTDCVVDVTQGTDECARIVTAKEKYFDVKLDDGTLVITQRSRNLFYRIIMHRIELKITLPASFRGKFRFRNNNGGLYAAGGRYSEMELATNNGKFVVSDCKCDGFSLKMKNGTVAVKNLNAVRAINVKCKNGNVKVESANAAELSISCSNAAMTAIDITSKKFECSTANGTIDASGVNAADIKLETSNGKICAAPIGSRDECKLSAETAHGVIIVDGVAHKRIADAPHRQKRMSVKTLNGDIDIRFV